VGLDGADGQPADVAGAPDNRGDHVLERSKRLVTCLGVLRWSLLPLGDGPNRKGD
jgi:hypothetical protein